MALILITPLYPFYQGKESVVPAGYARITLAIMSFYFMPDDYVKSAVMYLLSGLLDAFDGYAARYFNQSKYVSSIYLAKC